MADSSAKEDKKRKKLKKLLSESAANLAELFARSVLVTNGIFLILELYHAFSIRVECKSTRTGPHKLCTHCPKSWFLNQIQSLAMIDGSFRS